MIGISQVQGTVGEAADPYSNMDTIAHKFYDYELLRNWTGKIFLLYSARDCMCLESWQAEEFKQITFWLKWSMENFKIMIECTIKNVQKSFEQTFETIEQKSYDSKNESHYPGAAFIWSLLLHILI